ncbi:MAG: glycosyltransferase family 2 protein [Elusimicrobiaceae bacterium]|nr:glycosyltransferase family 2 protein [Elusimicrobiaceae bacterium]
MNNLITIIIPIHNGEKWLKTCFDSLTAQTNQAFNVIAVLDNCTDQSETAVNAYKNRLQLQVISVAHKSAAMARNEGLNRTQTAYCTFVDCDDYLHPETISDCYKLVLQSANQWQNVYSFGIVGRRKKDTHQTNLNSDDLNQNTCVARLYNTAFLNRNNIRFCDIPLREDYLFFQKCRVLNLKETNGAIGYVEYSRVLYYVNRNDGTKYDKTKIETAQYWQRVIDYIRPFYSIADNGTIYMLAEILVQSGTAAARELYETTPKAIKHRLQQNSVLHPKQYRARVKHWNASGENSIFQRLTNAKNRM